MEYYTHLCQIATQFGINSNKLNAVVAKYDYNYIFYVLEIYGYSMLKVLVVMAEKDLPIDFANKPTPPDGNCYLHALENQTFENISVIPHLSHDLVQELKMDKKQLRKLWCKTGEGYFAGKWGSKINLKGNMSDKEWEADWELQSHDGVYDGTYMASDLFVMVPAHRLRRHILIIDCEGEEGVIRLLDGNIFQDNK